ncbi:unnamed protein product [Closterium sp. NIES-64]|nr:unnamed protein product [Closterium sp. NIES-64]
MRVAARKSKGRGGVVEVVKGEQGEAMNGGEEGGEGRVRTPSTPVQAQAFRGRGGGKVGDGREGGRGGGGKGKRQVDWGRRERLDVECSEVWEEVDEVTPHDLAAADIVLVSYEMLSGDIWHDGPTRVLRHKKRYEARPTPLTRLHWWRVCLDEAQLVEGGTSRAAIMAARLCAQHWWCLSGTPIQKGPLDLQSLLRFFRASPFDLP